MLNQQTLEGMNRLKLFGMARAFERQRETPALQDQPFEDRFGQLVDAELSYRDTRRLARLKKTARLKVDACAEDMDFGAARGLDRRFIGSLLLCDWIDKAQNVIVTGPTGVGKTWLTCALGFEAIRHGMPVLYRRMPLMLEEFEIARADGSLRKLRAQFARAKLLIVDDWGIAPVSPQGRQDLLELVDDRIGSGSMAITSQLPVPTWHEFIGEPTIADAILDRLVHTAHRIELKGESMRRVKAQEAKS